MVWNPVQGGPGTNVVTFTLRVANSVSNFDQTLPITVYPAGTDLVPPSAVTGVELTEIGADHVGLRWNAATDNHGIAGYWVTATVHYRSRTCARNCTRSVYYRLGDYYTYTLVCNPTLATNAAAWLPAPGFSWPTTNTSVELPAATATNQFYRVKADYLTQP